MSVTTVPADVYETVSVKWSEIIGHEEEINKNPKNITFEVGKKYRPYVTIRLKEQYRWDNTPYEVEGWRKGASNTVTYDTLTEESGTISFQWDGVTTTDISITGFKTPVAGAKPVTTPTVVTTPEGTSAEVTDLVWKESSTGSGDGTDMTSGDTFKYDNYYRPVFKVNQKAYCNWKTAGGGSSSGEAYTGTITGDDGFSYTAKAYFMPVNGQSYAEFTGGYVRCSMGVVSDITIIKIDRPLAGNAPDMEAFVDVKPNVACDLTNAKQVTWEVSDDNGANYKNMATSTFEEGKMYRPCISFTLNDGYLIQTASGNGEGDYTGKVTQDSWLSKYEVTKEGNTISCKGAGVLCMSKQALTDISITGIEKPVAGNTPSPSASVLVTPEGACTVSGTVTWQVSNDNGATYTDMATTAFKLGNMYRPIIKLTLNKDNVFPTENSDGTGRYTGTVTGDDWISGYEVTKSGTTISCTGAGIPCEPKGVVSAISITGIEKPVAGDTPDKSASVLVTPEGACATSGEVTWQVSTNGGTSYSDMGSSAKFKLGEMYRPIITLTLQEGYVLPTENSDGTGKYTGTVTKDGWISGYEVTKSGTTISCTGVGIPCEPKGVVSNIAITGIEKPVAGNEKVTTATVSVTPAGACTVLGTVTWEVSTDGGTNYTPMNSSTKFELLGSSGKKMYRPIITLTLQEGYVFPTENSDGTGKYTGTVTKDEWISGYEVTKSGTTISCTGAGIPCEPKGVVSNISITGIEKPEIGATPGKSASVLVTPAGACTVSGTVTWQVSTNGGTSYSDMGSSDKFELLGSSGKKMYRPIIKLTLNADYQLQTENGDGTGRYTGKVTGDDWISGYEVTKSGTTISCKGVGIPCEPIGVVSDISITGIEKPEIGGTPGTTATASVEPSDAYASSLTVKWECSDNGGWTYTDMAAGDVFAEGNTYRPTVELTLKDGYLLRTASGDGTGDYTGTVTKDEWLSGYEVTQSGTTISCKGAGTQLAVANIKGGYITWAYDGDSRTLTISGTGAMEDYTSSEAAPWRNSGAGYGVLSGVCQKVVIESGITSIGNCSIYNFADLTSATIPDTVTAIGDFAFFNCQDLAEVTIPSGVTSIGAYAFLNSGMTELTLPAGVETIGAGAFKASQQLEKVTLPSGIGTIDEKVFENCTALDTITIPKSVTEIKKNAFNKCTALATATGKVIYLGTEEDWNKITIDWTKEGENTGNDALKNVIFHDKCNAATLEEKAAKPATCAEAGHRAYYECIGCGKCYADAAGTDPIPSIETWKAAGGAGYIAPSHTGVKQDGKAATCTEAGYREYYKCSSCEKYFTGADCAEEITVDVAVWKAAGGAGYLAAGHKFSATYLSENADAAKHYHICSVCNAKDAGAAHTWNAEAATATQDKHCTVCGFVAEPALAHTHAGTPVPGKAATCAEAGYKGHYKCSSCEKYFEDAACAKLISNIETWKAAGGAGHLAALGHKFSATYLSENADAAKHYHICSVCNAKDAGEAHTWNAEAATATQDKHCTVCGFEAEPILGHTHAGTLVAGKAATCTEAGVKDYYTCACGKAFEDAACATLISNIETWKAAGGAGYLAAGHTFAGEYDKANADAEKHYHICAVCNGKDAGEAHTWNAEAATETEDKHCTVCGYVAEVAKNHVHAGAKQAGKAATCTEAGLKDHFTCSCGMAFADEGCAERIADLAAWRAEGGAGYIAALGHDLSISHFDEKEHWKECARCGYVTEKQAHAYSGDADRDCDGCGFVRGLSVEIAGGKNSYVYTGSAVKPEVIVRNYGRLLTEGVDYTVSYKNNVKVSEGVAQNKKPAVIVKGKGDFAGTTQMNFEILPCPMADVVAGSIVVLSGAKATPVLLYNGAKLGTKDYVNPDAAKKFTENGSVTLTGKGNFTGEKTIEVKVVASKAELKKFTVTLGTEKLVYDGTEKKPSYTVRDVSTKEELKEGTDYTVVYSDNIVDAGSVKITFVGMGEYTGSVVKSYIINSCTQAGVVSVSGLKSEGYAYRPEGVRPEEDLQVTTGATGVPRMLTLGKDYTLSFSNCTKPGKAKYTIKFIGNYKGIKQVVGNYRINAAVLDDATEGLKISVADMAYTGKPGAYTSKPVVSVGGVLLKASDYKVSYYLDEAMTQEIKGKKNNVKLEDDAPVTVYVKITGKGGYGADTSKYATATYEVCPKEGVTDLKGAKITFTDENGATKSKFDYTGREVTPQVVVKVKDGKTWTEVSADNYTVEYHNNIRKGKATVVVKAKAGSGCVGGKSATFSIQSLNMGKIKDLWKKLFS